MKNDSLYLNPETWDLQLDNQGNIAYCKPPYATAQTVANAIKLFDGELYYNTNAGIPYFNDILGRPHSYSLYKHYIIDACKRVESVSNVELVINKFKNNILSGAVTFETDNKQYKIEL